MDTYRYDTIAHVEHPILCPVGRAKLDYIIENLNLTPHSRVLDLSAGKGELLIAILERYGCSADAIEPSPLFQASMRSEIAERLGEGRVQLFECEPYELDFDPESYDLIICMNSHPFGELRDFLARTWAMVRTGGKLLFGDWHWIDEEPDPDYLDFLNTTAEVYGTHEQVIGYAVKEAFTPVYAITATRDEIDHYEGQSMWSIEAWLRQNPSEPRAAAIRERWRKWRDGFLKWGRYELGFGVYVFLK